MLTCFGAELRHTLRGLRRSPVYSLAVILTLGLGIGANALVYAVADAVFFRPLPFVRGEELVGISMTHRAASGAIADFAVSKNDADVITSRARTLVGVGAVRAGTLAVTGGEFPRTVLGGHLSASMWTVLGVQPLAGRVFDAGEDDPAGDVVVISETLQRQLLPGEPAAALGRTLVVDGQPRAIIGVMPADFRPRLDPGELWLPLASAPIPATSRQLQLVARRAPGVTIEDVGADLTRIARELAQELPATNEGWGISVLDLRAKVGANTRPMGILLLVAVGLLLLLAAANVANLALARVARQRPEYSTRLALGAPRRSIMNRLLLEALLLGIAAGMLGMAVAAGALPPVLRMTERTSSMMAYVRLDVRIVVVVFLLTMLVAILCAVLPALHAVRVTASSPLAGGGRRAALGPGERRLRRGLVTLQVALAAMLLVASLAVVGALQRLGRADTGFDPDGVMVASVTLPAFRYHDLQTRTRLVHEVLEHLTAIPGVRSAAAVTNRFVRGQSVQSMHQVEGRAESDTMRFAANLRRIAGDYFQTLGVPLLQGRVFNDTDRDGMPPVVIVSRSFVREYMGNEEALGRRIRRGVLPWMTIVGITPDIMDEGTGRPIGPTVYLPYAQSAAPAVSFIVQSALEAGRIERAVREAITAVDRDLPIESVTPMPRLMDDTLGEERFRALVLSALSGLAVIVAALGIFGVTAYLSNERTRELAVRLALGDTPGGLQRLLLGDALRWIGGGTLVGLIGARALAQVVASRVPELGDATPTVYGATGALLVAVGLAASAWPALRAAATPPAIAMRAE